jgi:hypothetical protein
MSRILLSNLDPGTSDEELRAFLEKFGMPPCSQIEHIAGKSSRLAVELRFGKVDSGTLYFFLARIRDICWKGRQISAVMLRERSCRQPWQRNSQQ